MKSWRVVAVLAAALSACGGGSSGGSAQKAVEAGSTFSGTLSDGALLKVTLTQPAALRKAEVAEVAAALSVTGTITPLGGASISITGDFEPDANTFTLAGGGYTLSGSFANNALTATGTGPGGAVLLAAYRSDDMAVTVYCGTWQAYPSVGGFQEPLALVIRGSDIQGVTAQPSKPLALTGRLDGTSVVAYPAGAPGGLVGTLNGSGASSTITGVVNGKFEGQYGQVGTFFLSVCQ